MRVMLVLMCCLLAGGAPDSGGHKSKDDSSRPFNCDDRIVEYWGADEYYPGRIQIERLESRVARAVRPPNAKRSPQRTKWYVLDEPDFTRQGPWNTTLTIRGPQERATVVRVKFLDHASYGVRATWVNEKLLFVDARRREHA